MTKIFNKLINQFKNCNQHNDDLRSFFKNEYKKNADAAFWYYKTTNDLNFDR